jgi:hypothetical protein
MAYSLRPGRIRFGYELNIDDTFYFRSVLDSFIECHPELLPCGIGLDSSIKFFHELSEQDKSLPKTEII